MEHAARTDQDSLASLHSFQAQLLAAVEQALIATDLEGRILYWNPAAERLYGWRAQEVLGRDVLDVTPSLATRQQAKDVMATLRRGASWSGESRVRRKDGAEFLARVTASPVRDERGRLVGVVAISEDVTARRESDEQARRARTLVAQAEKLATMGSLVSGVAHEVRTPLAYVQNNLVLIQMRVDLARERNLPPPDMDELFAACFDGAERIKTIVDSLRRFTRLDANERVTQSLHEPVAEALALLRATYPGRVEIEERLAPTPPVRLNRLQVQQVVLNLVQNALEATRADGRVAVATQPTERGGARLVVDDEGPGVSPEARLRLFTEFYTTKPGGTGLGLSIVRRLVHDHGGSVWVDDAPGGGARFVVDWPAAPAAKAN